MRSALVLCVVVSLAGLGCFRTQYVNLQPEGPRPHHLHSDAKPIESDGWLHYFVFGLTPEEQSIPVGVHCNGLSHVDRLETERSGVQGLIAAIVYSPYTGRVVCDHGETFVVAPRPSVLEPYPLPTEYAVTREFQAPYHRVWNAVLRAMSEREMSIARADREAGVIVVPVLSVDPRESIHGRLGSTLGAPHTVLRREGRLVMLVEPREDGGTRVAIDVAMRIRVRTGNRDHHIPPGYEWREARSNLRLEQALLDRVDEQLGTLGSGFVGR